MSAQHGPTLIEPSATANVLAVQQGPEGRAHMNSEAAVPLEGRLGRDFYFGLEGPVAIPTPGSLSTFANPASVSTMIREPGIGVRFRLHRFAQGSRRLFSCFVFCVLFVDAQFPVSFNRM